MGGPSLIHCVGEKERNSVATQICYTGKHQNQIMDSISGCCKCMWYFFCHLLYPGINMDNKDFFFQINEITILQLIINLLFTSGSKVTDKTYKFWWYFACLNVISSWNFDKLWIGFGCQIYKALFMKQSDKAGKLQSA